MPARQTLRRFTALALVGGGIGLTAALAQPPGSGSVPAAPRPATGPGSAEDYGRPVAYLNGNVAVTRQELGEFLMARGGADKLELLLNKMIIENEARRLGFTVTEKEMEGAFLADLAGLSETGVKKGDFVSTVLPKYGKTLYEWMEDVVRPRLLLTKMLEKTIQVSEAEVQMQFEREYGEKRDVQIIMWPKGDDPKAILASYEKIRSSQAEFDSAARQMANPSLAANAGRIKPICKHTLAEDHVIEKIAFELKPGEVSQVLQTSQGSVVMKLHGVIPPDARVNKAAVKDRLTKQAFDEKLSAAIPAHFGKLREAAAPKTIYTGPSLWKWEGETKQAVEQIINNNVTPAGGTAPAPMPAPVPKK